MTQYVGRFAPSPSGPLHLGSLFTAVASYLDAKAHNGQWLLRIEDIDPPREQPNAPSQIIETLTQHGLSPDADIFWQHERLNVYRDVIAQLLVDKNAYYCTCTRAQIKAVSPLYQGQCRHADHTSGAVRWKNQHKIEHFVDRWQGCIQVSTNSTSSMPTSSLITDQAFEDPIIQRKDGLFAYNLAVVLDDIAQGITHIVRGYDLLPTTLLQQNLWLALSSQPIPEFAHCPVLVTAPGKKLSKQNHAPAINDENAIDNLRYVLTLMGLPSRGRSIAAILEEAIEAWYENYVIATPQTLLQEIIVDLD